MVQTESDPQMFPGVTSKGVPITSVVEEDLSFHEWDRLRGASSLVLVDSSTTRFEATKSAIGALSGPQTHIASLNAGEEIKNIEQYRSIFDPIRPLQPTHIVLIGGGTILNVGLYFAAELSARRKRMTTPVCSLIPTNTMAMADVAVGGLGLLNDRHGLKNRYIAKKDPSYIFLFQDYIEGSPPELKRDGIPEVIKHSILQCPSITANLVDLYLAAEPEGAATYRAAKRGMSLKGDVLGSMRHASFDEVEFLLSYGHLHAHVIEEHWRGNVPHGRCVFLGIILDLYLSGYVTRATTIAAQARRSAIATQFAELLTDSLCASYLEHYPTSGRFVAGANEFFVLRVGEDNEGRIVGTTGLRNETVLVTLGEIHDAMAWLQQRLS